MFYVYLLQSKQNQQFYVGFSPNLKERIIKHNAGQVQSTKRYMPWELIYYEAYRSKDDAIQREQQLKHFAKGFAILKRRVHDSLLR
ncbi:MAG: GIY-YIG nuclease family protein [Nanoarchaeota archaeon]|nr:GIY-YIG nuclease family protein [Nanoarchaeota archaeon]